MSSGQPLTRTNCPELTNIYRSDVKAAAFRIPSEMVAILIRGQASEAVEEHFRTADTYMTTNV